MTAPSDRLLEWIRKRRTDLTERGLIQRVELWHAVDGEQSRRLEVYDLAEREPEEDIDELTIEIWKAAEDDASTLPQGSHQRYLVMLFRGEEDREPEETKGFTIQGSMLSHYFGGSDPPNERGVLAQELRQRNEMHALMLRACDGIAGGMERQLRSEREWSLQLEAKRRQSLITEEQMLDRSQERELERQAAEKKEQRLDMVVQTLTTLAPIILSKLFERPATAASAPPSPPAAPGDGGGAPGAGGLPNPPPPSESPFGVGVSLDQVRKTIARDTSVSNILGTLDQKQMSVIAGVLRPEQAMGFLEIYESYQEDHRKHMAAQSASNRAPRRPDFSHGEDTHGSEETH